MLRATTSRGASDPIGWYLCMNSLPFCSLSSAPNPRIASLIRNDGRSPGLYSEVGWNCRNCMFSTAPFARCTIAMPSPVATAGLVVVW